MHAENEYKQDVAIEKLETLRQADDDARETLRAGTVSAWDNLSGGIRFQKFRPCHSTIRAVFLI